MGDTRSHLVLVLRCEVRRVLVLDRHVLRVAGVAFKELATLLVPSHAHLGDLNLRPSERSMSR